MPTTLSRRSLAALLPAGAVVLALVVVLLTGSDGDAEATRAEGRAAGRADAPEDGVASGAAARAEEVETSTTTTTTTSTTTSTAPDEPVAPPTTAATAAAAAPVAAAPKPTTTTTAAPRPRPAAPAATPTTTTTTSTTAAPAPAAEPGTVPPPEDAGIEDVPVDARGIPIVSPDAAVTIWTLGCESGTARYVIRQGDDGDGDGLPDRVLQVGELDRRDDAHPGERARYAGTVRPLAPAAGLARAYVSLDCSGAAMEFWFELRLER